MLNPTAGSPCKFSVYGVRNETHSDDKVPLLGSIKLAEKPVQVKVVSHWCDQLQGDKKAVMYLRLKKADGTTVDHDLFGVFQRGEDLKYIHWAELKDDDVVTKAEAGDEYEILTVTGPSGSYKEQDDVEGEIEYAAELRVFMLNMQINAKMDDPTPVPDSNVQKAVSTNENTEFEPLWTHIRDNLKSLGRIKDSEVPSNMIGLW